MMMIDVADVNALVTGTDMKSTRKPELFAENEIKTQMNSRVEH